MPPLIRKIRGWRDQILRTQSGAVDVHAQEMATDAEEAMGVAAAGDVHFCQYTASIVCLDEDPDRLYESVIAPKATGNCRTEPFIYRDSSGEVAFTAGIVSRAGINCEQLCP